jgi:hypothetical protein
MRVGMDVQPGARVHVGKAHIFKHSLPVKREVLNAVADGSRRAFYQLMSELESPAAQYPRHLFLKQVMKQDCPRVSRR